MDSFFHLFFALLALGFLVFIHELGHYFVARRVGMKVEVFSIGFGRPIVSWMYQGVRWQIGWIICGGYVKIAGMEGADAKGRMAPDGFFGKKPMDRLKVAVAGPLANLLLALLIFCLLYASGGRSQPFATFSHFVGAVDQESLIASEGVKAGDQIETVKKAPYTGYKDLLYAAVFNDDPIPLTGEHISLSDGSKSPFSLSVKPYVGRTGMKTLGITAPARLLIVDQPAMRGSPMQESGIQQGDRLIWAEGEPIYSMEQLSFLINEQKAVLTVQRGSSTVIVRVPRVSVSSLKLKASELNDLDDWQYAAGLKKKLSSLIMIPYRLTLDGTVQSAFDQDKALQAGDKIIAVDGLQTRAAGDILKALQEHHVTIIVQRGVEWPEEISWKDSNEWFSHLISWAQLEKAVSAVGLGASPDPQLVILKPVIAKPFTQFDLSSEEKKALEQQLTLQKKEIESISDPTRRNEGLKLLQEEKDKLRLGIGFSDLFVRYNPLPTTLFFSVFKEMTETLKSLVAGVLNPSMLSGPIGIVHVMQSSWSVGAREALFWVAAISINLGVLNLMPLPVLDGGYILLSLYEMVTKKRVNPKVLERIVLPFVIALVIFFLFVTYYDIKRLL